MKPPSGFGDAEAKRIIARAAELDAQDQQRLDVNALREIAAEAGISPTAVDRALQERVAAPPTLASRLIRRPVTLLGVAILALIFLMRLIG